MAGLAGLPYFIQYQGQLQQQEQAKQQQQMQLQMFQQAQQDRQRQQAAQAAAGNALPQLLQGGMPAQQPQFPPPPQPPAPGQASQPMQQPQGAAPGGAQPPLPPGGIPQGAQGQQQPIPPFRPMPTTPPQSMAPQGAIPAPPAQAAATAPQQGGGPLTLQGAVKVLQDQGLSGADLMAGLQQLTPVLDSASKAQAAQLQQQFNQELKVQQLGVQRESLQARIDAAKQASEDRRLGIQERQQAHLDSLGMQREMMAFRIQEAKAKHAADPDGKLDKETVDILAQQALAGDTSVYQNLGRGVQGAQNIVAIRKRVAELAKGEGKGGADIAAGNVAFQGEKAAARSSYVSGAKQAQAADEANTLADQALDVSKQIARTNSPTINAGLNALRKQGGDPAVSRFNVAIQGFRNTYSRAISPTGAPTVHDKQHADELFDMNQSPEAFAASMDQAKREMTAALSAPGHIQAQQRARIAGGSKPAAGGAPETKVIGGKTYVQQNGKWYEQ